MSFITSIGTAVPAHKFEQRQISAFMERLAPDDEIKKQIQKIFRASGIRTRYSVLSDYGKESGFHFFPNNKSLHPFPSTSMRMKAFRQHATLLSLEAIRDCYKRNNFSFEDITHLITVSCTGMYAPGLDVDLVNQIPLRSSVSRTSINFMGCFAAISAIKVADSFCVANSKAKVLIVCTELCSLHFQKECTDDNILSNALFADGSAAVLIEANKSEDGFHKGTSKNSLYPSLLGEGEGVEATKKNVFSGSLKIESTHSEIISSGKEHMAWTIGDTGFEMKLSAYVPMALSSGIASLVSRLAEKANLNASVVSHFAIHPGGKKILESVAAQLNLSKDQLAASYQTLRDFGNMSSPTVLFVLKKILEGSVLENDRILAMAFGPGITVESLLLNVEYGKP